MIKVTCNPLTPWGQGVLKATLEVRSWPSDVLFLVGFPDEVFRELGLTGRGKNQKKLLAAAHSGDVVVFMNGFCILLGQTSETAVLREMSQTYVPLDQRSVIV